MKYLVLDFESKDPYISRGCGAGWVYMMNTPNHDFKVLGCAVKRSDSSASYIRNLGPNALNKCGMSSDSGFINFIGNLYSAIQGCDALVAHNAQYDFGILLAMGISLKDKLLFDTAIMSKLHYNALQSHSLDNLGKVYFKEKKEKKQLADAVWDHDLYPWTKKELKEKEKSIKIWSKVLERDDDNELALENNRETAEDFLYERTRPPETKLQKFAIENMDLLQDKCPEIVVSYAIQDVVLTEKLFKFFLEKAPNTDWTFYSDLIKCCLKMRMNGIQIDLNKVRETHKNMISLKAQALNKCHELAGKEFNIRSPKEVPAILKTRGIELPKTDKGGDSVTTAVLESTDDGLCKALLEARKLIKIDNDFVQHLEELQQWTLGIPIEEVAIRSVGVIYPEVHIMGATATGRMSSSSPNIQQIPSRDPIYGPLCRNLFIAPQGKSWYSLDFSNQEGRLQLETAHKLDCFGVNKLVKQFQLNPNIDMHLEVARLIWGKHITKDSIERKWAKTINLGLSYGMGIKKLANSLTMKEEDAKLILEKYHNKMPYLKELIKQCQEQMKQQGYITTILGRKIWDEESVWYEGKEISFEYKALNKVIQGSAADQTMLAMVLAYREGLDLVCAVHDELNIVSDNPNDALKLKQIMETCIPSTIPHVSEITSGTSWGQAKFGVKA